MPPSEENIVGRNSRHSGDAPTSSSGDENVDASANHMDTTQCAVIGDLGAIIFQN